MTMDPPTSRLEVLALFADGVSRAAILPFVATTSMSSSSAMAWLVSFWIVGRYIGTLYAKASVQRMSIGRIVGFCCAIHVLSFHVGPRLFLIRLVAGFLVGVLLGRQHEYGNAMDREQSTSSDGFYDEAKISLVGFAASVLFSGGLYYILTHSWIFRVITFGEEHHVLPGVIFLVTLVLVTESVVEKCCSLGSTKAKREEEEQNLQRKPSWDEEAGKYRTGSWDAPRKASWESQSRKSSRLVEDKAALRKASWDGGIPVRRIPSKPQMLTPLRRRLDSARSDWSEEFFDCSSSVGSLAMEDVLYDVNLASHSPNGKNPATALRSDASAVKGRHGGSQVAAYVNGKVVYSNGLPAFVPAGECEDIIPQNYLDFYNGNTKRAQAMWQKTQIWRKENEIWKIHSVPNVFFPKIKKAYPHFIHGYSKKGYPVVYEQPGKMDLVSLFRNEGCKVSDMLTYYAFLQEYIWNCVATKEEVQCRRAQHSVDGEFSAGLVVVMDVYGASLTMLSTDVVKYLKLAGDINSNHYPNTVKHAFPINTPFLIASAWSGIKNLLPEAIHGKVEILSTSYLERLRVDIDDDQIPPEYGGSSPYSLGQHPFELELWDVAKRAENYSEHEIAHEIAVHHTENTVDRPLEQIPSCDDEDAISGQDHNIPVEAQCAADHIVEPFMENGENKNLDNVGRKLRSASWKNDVSLAPRINRRRANSEGISIPSTPLLPTHREEARELQKVEEQSIEEYNRSIIVIVSVIHLFWSATLGVVETALPLWMATPPLLGGLGYMPAKCGVSVFSASIVLMWLMRSKVARAALFMPNNMPMRAFRVGVGAQAVLFSLLPLVPSNVISIRRNQSLVVMASTIIVLSCMALACLLGASASANLHRAACRSLAANCSPEQDGTFCGLYNRLSPDRRFTVILGTVGHVLGVLIVAPVFGWSSSAHRPHPFDAPLCFYAASLVSFVIYVLSFSLHMNDAGEFVSHPVNENTPSKFSWCTLVGEVLAVSLGDMASLFEEANWSSSPVLGLTREKLSGGRHK